MTGIDFAKFRNELERIDTLEYVGKIRKIVGLGVESTGPMADIGTVCRIYKKRGNEYIDAEVVGFTEDRILLMPYGDLKEIGIGCKVVSTRRHLEIPVYEGLLGRVLDGLANPIDFSGHQSADEYKNADNDPPHPLTRSIIDKPIKLGIRAMDGLLTCGEGQRLGIFSGSGVGKSTLLGMIARNSGADVNVIALIGERGREVKEFLEGDLRQEGLAKSVVVVATSDQPALVRVKAAQVATSIAGLF